MAIASNPPASAALYRTIWRWHFYAGLFVMPFIVLLSVTGAIYLFKPQIDAWEERAYRDLPAGPSDPVAQVRAALAAHPGATFNSYRVPLAPGDAALVHVALPRHAGMRDVFVGPQGDVVASLDPEARITEIVSRIHGSLLLGTVGDWLVELAASWAIVMIVTGLYLWWPRGRGWAGVLWPRRRAFLRDLHAVAGFWVAGLALVTLASGLPWAGAWGNALLAVRTTMGWVQDRPDWKLGAAPRAEHEAHDHAAMAMRPPAPSLDRLPEMAAHARAAALAFPAVVKPPGVAERFGQPGRDWIVASESQNRPLRVTIHYDAATGRELRRSGWADKHPIDRAIGLGIAWHEGQLLGWPNQLVGLLTALALIALAISAFLMWRRRRPEGRLGAPPLPATRARLGGVAAIVLGFALLLPMLAASLVALFAVERLLLARLPAARAWLGLQPQ